MQFSYFSKLSQREKYYIISGLVIVIGFFLHYFVWTPLSTSNQNLLAQINQQEELLHWMQAQQIEIKQNANLIEVLYNTNTNVLVFTSDYPKIINNVYEENGILFIKGIV